MPLSDFALELLQEQHVLTGAYEHVFASPRTDFKRPLLASATTHALRGNLKAMGLDHFTPHDLRRTVRSRLASLGSRQSLRAKS